MDVGPSVSSPETPAALFPTSPPVPASPQPQASTPASRLAFPGNPPQAVRMASKLFKQISHPYRPDPGRLGSHPAALMGDRLYSPDWLLLGSARGEEQEEAWGMATDVHPSWSLGRPQNGTWASPLAKGTVTLGPGLGHLPGAIIPHPSCTTCLPGQGPHTPQRLCGTFGPDMNVLEQKAQEPVRPWCPEVPKGASLGFINIRIRVQHASEC